MSVNRTVFLLIFMCAALTTSVFIFRLNHQPSPAIVTHEAMTFPIPRDIQPFELITADNKKFSHKDLLNHWTLIFFGFTHCSSICPTTLDMVSRAYTKLHRTYPNLQVVLISLDPQRDTPEVLANYTHSFNPDFIGASGSIKALRKLQAQLGIFSAQDDATGNYQIQHTSSILLVNPQGKWAGLFKFGMKPEQFIKNFNESIKSLS